MTAVSEHDIEILKKASNFGLQFWLNHQNLCQYFIKGYPLTRTLTKQNIEDLIRDYTLDENYQLATEDKVMQSLRQLRNLLMLRWVWQDALGIISFEQLTDELSEFADGCIKFAKKYVYEQLTSKYGIPSFINKMTKKQEQDDMAIIAMGKLGAHELNLSSDIDLIFIHKAQGMTNTDGFVDAKQIDNKKFMLKLGQGIIKLLDANTSDGFVFRVDMRLRPWGDGSDLAIHTSALEKYFTQHGRDWERFAWLKSRLVNDDIDSKFAESIQDITKLFVFRYYVDYTAFSALRDMKSMIQNQVAQREDLTNIKLGAGGIRDIEFIVQAFQLMYGGRHPSLQIKPCLKAMKELHRFNFLEDVTYKNLEEAYRFLRRLEHGIQAINDQQTQKLPSDEHWQNNLADILGFENWHKLLEKLAEHRQKVSKPFEEMITYRQTSTSQHELIFNSKDVDMLKNELNTVLDENNLQKLQQFWSSKLVKSLTEQARSRLDEVYPILIKAMLLHNEQFDNGANIVLPRLLNLLESICRRSIYLVMMLENPDETIHLIPMLSASPWIADELVRYPVLMDTFLQRRYQHLPDRKELKSIIRQRLLRVEPSDEESLLSVLRLFKKMQVLAVAESDVIAERPLMKVSDSLTHIAEVVLETSLERAFTELVRKHGYPINKKGEPVTESNCGFAIIGYGKLGGIELSYSSDLDLVFIHDIDELAMTTGEKPLSGMKFAARLSQKLMTYLNTQTRDGRAYEIDMRLRPSGNAGMMVVSSQAFKRYQLENAWEWEHQALVRSRAICGDSDVIRNFNDIRQQVLCTPRSESLVQSEIAKMRQKMQQHLGSDSQTKESSKFHLKQDEGGIIDIEFIAQYGVLSNANKYPELTKYSDNVRIFEMLAKHNIWSEQCCQQLTDAYLLLRTAIHQLALAKQPLTVNADDWQNTRDTVIKNWNDIIGQR